MLVVADTSPLNYLVLMQQDTLLPTLYERVMIPPAVREELQRPRTPQAVRQWVEKLVGDGLRAQVTSASLLTGFKLIGLEMDPGAPPKSLRKSGRADRPGMRHAQAEIRRVSYLGGITYRETGTPGHAASNSH